MKTYLPALALGLAALGGASPASAATFVLGIGPNTGSTFFGNSKGSAGAINDTFRFTVPKGSVSAYVGSIALTKKLDVTLTSVTLDGILHSFHQDLTGPEEKWSMGATSIGAGTHTLKVLGSWGTKGGAYSGTLNFDAVPEPATWALMILGFAGIGAAMRRRRAPALRLA